MAIFIGDEFDNYLVGEKSDDSLAGLGGNDTLDGGAGNDTLDGGAGDDLYIISADGSDPYSYYSYSNDTVTEQLDSGADTIESSVNFSLPANVETLLFTGSDPIGGSGNELDNNLTGNTGDNWLSGGAGNDTLYGNAGNDYLDGGEDNDSLIGGEGNDSLYGNGGSDSLSGGAGDDYYSVDTTLDTVTEDAGAGTDTVYSEVSYTLGANLENLELGWSGAYSGTGNALDNTIRGNNTDNILEGLEGSDTLIGRGGNDSLDGGAGDDYLSKNDFDYYYYSVPGNVTLNGGAGNDTLTGGEGDDLYIVDSAGDSVVEMDDAGSGATPASDIILPPQPAGGGGIDTVESSVSWTLGDNLEHLTLTGTDNTSGTGNSLDNAITGSAGNNSLMGGAGSDTLDGGAGSDTLDGGAGSDTLTGGAGDDLYIINPNGGGPSYSYSYDQISEQYNSGTDTVQSSTSIWSLAANVENLILVGGGPISGTGNELDNTIIGNATDNYLNGGAGNDTIDGGAGNDNLSGSSGNDSLIGGEGNDTLDGYGGNHTLIGGAGDDVYNPSGTLDQLIEDAGAGTDTVYSNGSWTLGANLENLVLWDGVRGTGNALNNSITGNANSNTLSGLEGNDTLDGGDNGTDTLTGGAGSDSFRLKSYGADVIADFSAAEADKILLSKWDFYALTSAPGAGFSVAGEFATVESDAGASTSGATIVYSTGSGNLFYNTDGSAEGFGYGGQIAALTGSPALTAADFIIEERSGSLGGPVISPL
ncbi:calcium-binding protein [Kamptonema formosum]|uniref:calcium-binding protein n=1 Tax=Kamptonema formosum TaxID=331992 RepID=UPI000344DDDB|nr:calcium-binding protein [Oscillatoria sp. PCC 10802]